MKRLTALIMAVFLVLSLAPQARGDFDPEVDYMARMLDAVASGDEAAGGAAELSRNEKIAALEMEHIPIAFQDLNLLAKIMYAEAGSVWLDDDWRLCVGEVVLNRVASPEFPNTIQEVLDQPGQYYGPNNPYFLSLLPGRNCAVLAQRLLEGYRSMEPSVVFQANFQQGSGVYLARCDSQLGWTYFCYSLRPELYPG